MEEELGKQLSQMKLIVQGTQGSCTDGRIINAQYLPSCIRCLR